MERFRGLHFAVFALCLGLFLPIQSAQAGHFDGRYVIRGGDLNGDGRTDLHVRHNPTMVIVPLDDIPLVIPRQRSQIEEFILQQNANGSFTLIPSLTSAQRATAAQWPLTSLERSLGDFNADGRVDMMIKGISSIAAGASDVMVYAPLAERGPARGVRAVDDNYRKFVRDVAGRIANPAYFEPGWTLVEVITVTRVLPTYYCGGGLYWRDLSSLYTTPDETIGGGFELPDFTPPPGCQFVGNMAWDIEIEHWVFDPSSFSSEAITFLNTTLPYLNSSNPMPLSTAQSAVDQLSTMLQVQYGAVDFEFTFDVFGGGAMGGIGLPLPRPGSPPVVLPPVVIPGSPENKEWADLFYELLRRMATVITTSIPARQPKHDCLAVTDPNVRTVLAGSPMLTLQPSVSAAEIAIKVEIIKFEGVHALPPIYVDGFVIVNGNHRFIAAKLCHTEMPQQEWTAPMSPPRFPIYTIRLDP